MINNAQIDVVSDRQTKFNLKYVNKYKSRDIKFTASDLNLRKPDGNFRVGLDGQVSGEQVSGSVEGKKTDQGYRIKVNIEKGNRKALQFDAKVKADPAKMQYSTKTIYSVLGGVIQGTIIMKYENKEFTFSHVNKDTKEKMDLRVFLNPGHKLEIEA